MYRATTKEELRTFPRIAGSCRMWIPGFGLMAKPLDEALSGTNTDSHH